MPHKELILILHVRQWFHFVLNVTASQNERFLRTPSVLKLPVS